MDDSRTVANPIAAFAYKSFVIAEFEIRKLRHDFTELVTRALQPALWLLIFGQVFAKSGMMHTGSVPYLDFIAPGILAQSVLFVAIFYGINVIWERDLGIVQKFLVSPTPRSALVLGKGFSAGIRTLSQAAVVYLLALASRCEIGLEPLGPPERRGHRHPVGDPLLHLFPGGRLHREDARALHGRGTGLDHAAVLREQRHLSHRHHAGLAADRFPPQPPDLRGGRPARLHAGRQHWPAAPASSGWVGTIRSVLVARPSALVLVGARLYPRLAT
jgi:hypothetical protein